MNNVFRIIIILLAVSLLSRCKKELEIEMVSITDHEFLEALIHAGVDTDGDNMISRSEAEVISFLDIGGTFDNIGNIESLKGIEAFINLDTLICSYNAINNLDVTNNSMLSLLNCSNNQLNSLNVNSNNRLLSLYCNDNQLTDLDVSGNTLLEELWCFQNELTSLNMVNNSNLITLYCDWNPLSELDCSNLKQLKYLRCTNTTLQTLKIANCESLWGLDCFNIDNNNFEAQLTSLDCSGCYSLYHLEMSNNIISNLDITDCTILSYLRLTGNRLEKLDISNNISLSSLILKHMPELTEVCVWTMPFPPAGVTIDTTSSPNVYFTTDCSK